MLYAGQQYDSRFAQAGELPETNTTLNGVEVQLIAFDHLSKAMGGMYCDFSASVPSRGFHIVCIVVLSSP